MRVSLAALPGQTLAGRTVSYADDISYRDPNDNSQSTGQGIRIGFEDGTRIIYRLSGTGTEGATLRVYMESYERDPERQLGETQEVMAPVVALAVDLAGIETYTGRSVPDVIT